MRTLWGFRGRRRPLCAACGAPLETMKGAERKLGTMVFADLVGSTMAVIECPYHAARTGWLLGGEE